MVSPYFKGGFSAAEFWAAMASEHNPSSPLAFVAQYGRTCVWRCRHVPRE